MSEKDTLYQRGQAILKGASEADRPVLSKFGLCASCAHFRYARTELSTKFAECGEFERPLSERNPITTCNQHISRGHPTVWQMYDMAVDIEGKVEKEFKGFQGVDKEDSDVV